MALVVSGTPFVGLATLGPSPGPPGLGPLAFTLYTDLSGGSPYTLAAAGTQGAPNAERCYVCAIAISTNDATGGLVVVDAGADSVNVVSAYVTAAAPLVQHIPLGVLRLVPGVAPRITAAAIASGKALVATILGYVSRG